MTIKMQQNDSKINIQQAYEKFILSCRNKNLSVKTIQYYESEYNRFSHYVNQHDSVKTITSQLIQQYCLHLQTETNANDVSIQTYMRGIRAFCYYLMRTDYIPTFHITLPRAQKKIKPTYTDAELETLLKKPNKKSCTFAQYRTWVYILYLLSTGNRISSVANIRIKDIDFQNGYISLTHTKNKQQQIIPMSTQLNTILQEYLAIRGGNADDFLFCGDEGQPLGVSGLETAIKRYMRPFGIQGGSHKMRHTFAKKYLLAGGDVFRLQKLMGHSDISVTKEYVEMFSEDLKIDYDRFNPLDNMIGNKQKIKMK